MRTAPLVAVASVSLLVSAAAVTLHAAYWTTEILATGAPGGVGYFNATGVQHGTGHLYVAYSDNDKDDVLVRWWTGTTWQVQTVDAGRYVARGIDLAFGPGPGYAPAVSYAGGALKYAERVGSSWAVKTVESKNAMNDVTSLEFSNGQPAISYYASAGKRGGTNLKLARRAGTSWTTTTLTAGVRYSSLAFDASGYPAIAYAADTSGDGFADSLRLARQSASGWTFTTIDDDPRGAGTWARLGFDPATGRPVVVDVLPSAGGEIRFWSQDALGDWQSAFVGTGYRPALLVHQGDPIVTYGTPDGYGVVVSRRSTGWSGQVVAGAPFGYVQQMSLAVPYGTSGEPAVAYCVEIYGINGSRTLWLARPGGY